MLTAPDIHRSCNAQAQMSASSRPGTSSDNTMTLAIIAVIDPLNLIPSVQIPIAHHRC